MNNFLFADFSIEELKNIISKADDSIGEKDVLLYPNPVADKFMVSSKVQDKYQYVYIYNYKVQIVLKENLESNIISTAQLN